MKVRLCADFLGKNLIMLDGRQVPSQRTTEVEGYQHGLSSCALVPVNLLGLTCDQGPRSSWRAMWTISAPSKNLWS